MPRDHDQQSLDPATARILTAQHQPRHLTSAPGCPREPTLLNQFREAAAFNVSNPNLSSFAPNDLYLCTSILTATRAESQTQLLGFTNDRHIQGQIQSLNEFCDGLSTSLRTLHQHENLHQQPQYLDGLIELRLFVALVYPKLLQLQEWMNIPSLPVPDN